MLRVSSFLGLISVLIIAMLLIGACAAFEDPAQRATQNAENTALWTMVYGFQTEMPTMQAIVLTADSAVFLSTQVAQVNNQNEFLRATNAALLSGSGGQGVAPFVPPTAIGGGQPAGALPTSSNNQPTILLTPNTTTSNTTTTTTSNDPVSIGGARFTQPATSAAINNDGCASGITNTFAQSTSGIYFVTTVLDLPPGIEFGLRITQGGTVVANDLGFWTSDTTYPQTCVWYNIDRETMSFLAGTYVAELLANNQVASTVTFVISG